MYWANKAFKRLKLKPILIHIDKIKYPDYSDKAKYPDELRFWQTFYEAEQLEEGLGLFRFALDDMFINVAQFSKKLPVYVKDRQYKLSGKLLCIFAIFHEIAHYFQYYYYEEWMMYYEEKERYFCVHGKHCDERLERNADKIAMILFKEFALDK